MVLGDVEETLTQRSLDPETDEEVSHTAHTFPVGSFQSDTTGGV
jgi:hypothetical protein